MKAMESRLKKDFLSLYQVLRGCEIVDLACGKRIPQSNRPKKPHHQTKTFSSQHPHPRSRGNSNEESISIIRQRDREKIILMHCQSLMYMMNFNIK